MTLFRLDASINPATSASRAIARHRRVRVAGRESGRHGRPPRPRHRAAPGRRLDRRAPRELDAGGGPHAGASRGDRAGRGPGRGAALGRRRAAGRAALQLRHPAARQDLDRPGPGRAKSADEALLAGKPAVLVVVRGGAYGAGTPREGWDHSTGYLRRIIADVWGADLTLVEREFTLVGVNPALDDFKDLAGQFKDAAHAAAARGGQGPRRRLTPRLAFRGNARRAQAADVSAEPRRTGSRQITASWRRPSRRARSTAARPPCRPGRSSRPG